MSVISDTAASAWRVFIQLAEQRSSRTVLQVSQTRTGFDDDGSIIFTFEHSLQNISPQFRQWCCCHRHETNTNLTMNTRQLSLTAFQCWANPNRDWDLNHDLSVFWEWFDNFWEWFDIKDWDSIRYFLGFDLRCEIRQPNHSQSSIIFSV